MSDELDGIINLVEISPRLGTAGQPTRAQFPAVAAAGYELVVNLAMSDSTGAIPDEAAVVVASGMRYVHIPVVWEQPLLDDLSAFFDLMDSNRDRKVFVHCAFNFRVSTFVYLYRVLRLGEDPALAEADMLSVWQPDDGWRTFIALALKHTW